MKPWFAHIQIMFLKIMILLTFMTCLATRVRTQSQKEDHDFDRNSTQIRVFKPHDFDHFWASQIMISETDFGHQTKRGFIFCDFDSKVMQKPWFHDLKPCCQTRDLNGCMSQSSFTWGTISCSWRSQRDGTESLRNSGQEITGIRRLLGHVDSRALQQWHINWQTTDLVATVNYPRRAFNIDCHYSTRFGINIPNDLEQLEACKTHALV